jgi:hypothetical protein
MALLSDPLRGLIVNRVDGLQPLRLP